jgi:hypothetical protein
MDFKAESINEKPVDIEPFSQNGTAGCVTACLANVARILKAEDITPDDVDRELDRSPGSDVTGYTRNLWLLQRGLTLTVLCGPNPTQFTELLDGEISFEQFLTNMAKYRFGGDVGKTRGIYDCPEYKDYVSLQRQQRVMYEPVLAEYGRKGKYEEVPRQPTFADIEGAINDNRVVIYHTIGRNGISHQELAYSASRVGGQSLVGIYSPDYSEGKISVVDSSQADYLSIDYRVLTIVSA